MTILPTGIQYQIQHDDLTAVVTEVGATLRSLQWRGKEMLWTFEQDEAPQGFAGATLMPWPNRIRDGAYTFDGTDYLLPVNEHVRQTALHGFVFATPWALVRRSDQEITLSTVVYPQIGWPGVLHAEVTYRVDEDGLTTTYRATNAGTVDIPFGYGTHPLFAFDDIGAVEVTSPFSKELLVDERLLPTEVVDIPKASDFRKARVLGDTEFDTAFTGVDGAWEIVLRGSEHTVTVWADERHPWVQIFTRPERSGIAVEPMTCGPDAFNEGPTHDDLIRLAPAESAEGTWGVKIG